MSSSACRAKEGGTASGAEARCVFVALPTAAEITGGMNTM